MLVRVLIVGVLLAGLTGAAVFYGFGDLDGNVNDVANESSAITKSEAISKNNEASGSITSNLNTELPKTIIDQAAPNSAKPTKPDVKKSDVNKLEAKETDVKKPVDEKATTKMTVTENAELSKEPSAKLALQKPATDTLKEMLNTPQKMAQKDIMVKDIMVKDNAAKDNVTGAFIVQDDEPEDNMGKDIMAAKTPSDSLMTDTLQSDNLPSDTLQSDNLPSDNLPSDNLPSDNLPSDDLPTVKAQIAEKLENAESLQNSAAEIPLADLSDEEILSISESLIKARETANKTERDKIYLEVFDNAIESGSIELAARVSDKLSTPKLRELTRDIIDNTGK